MSKGFCKHGLANGDCEQCSPAPKPANGAVVPFGDLNMFEKKAALKELVREVGPDKTPAEVLAIAEDHGMTGRGVTAVRISELRIELGFPKMGKVGRPKKATGPEKAVPDKKPVGRPPKTPKPRPEFFTIGGKSEPPPVEDESPLVSVAELGEFARLVKAITPAVARQLLEIMG